MPSYLSTVFQISLIKNGSFNAATQFANGIAALLSAPLAAYIIQVTHVQKTIWIRKLFQGIAMFGPALCVVLIPWMECNSTAVTALLISSQLLYGFFTGGEWTTISDYAPNFAGTIFGFANILAFAMAVLAPYLVGVLLDSSQTSSRSQWNIIFYITFAVYTFGGITYLFFGTDQQQDWDKVGQSKKDDSEQEAEEYSSDTESSASSATFTGDSETSTVQAK